MASGRLHEVQFSSNIVSAKVPAAFIEGKEGAWPSEAAAATSRLLSAAESDAERKVLAAHLLARHKAECEAAEMVGGVKKKKAAEFLKAQCEKIVGDLSMADTQRATQVAPLDIGLACKNHDRIDHPLFHRDLRAEGLVAKGEMIDEYGNAREPLRAIQVETPLVLSGNKISTIHSTPEPSGSCGCAKEPVDKENAHKPVADANEKPAEALATTQKPQVAATKPAKAPAAAVKPAKKPKVAATKPTKAPATTVKPAQKLKVTATKPAKAPPATVKPAQKATVAPTAGATTVHGMKSMTSVLISKFAAKTASVFDF
jgi:hypothetical protein